MAGNNVYMDTVGNYYTANSPTNPNDCLIPYPRPELVTALNAVGTHIDQDTIAGIVDPQVVANNPNNPQDAQGA